MPLQFAEAPRSACVGIAIALLVDVPMETFCHGAWGLKSVRTPSSRELCFFALMHSACLLACHAGLWWWRSGSVRTHDQAKLKQT